MSLPLVTAMRQVMGDTLAELGHEHPSLLVLDGDVANSTGAAAFEAAYPQRFVQCGIAEQNMVGMAAGLATVGYTPFVTSFACFAVARALDSVRVLIAQPPLNVKIMGGYAGLLTGKTGKTHQMLNDVAVMRSMPNMQVIAPADEHEMRAVLRRIVAAEGPVYVQVSRDPSPVLFDASHTFEPGKAVQTRDGTDATLVSTGAQSARVYEAAEILAGRGLHVRVLHMPSIEPMDEPALVDAARHTGFIITVEEQDVRGGLGGAVAEVLSDQFPVPVRRLGLTGRYGESGANDDLLHKYRLSSETVAHDAELLIRAPAS